MTKPITVNRRNVFLPVLTGVSLIMLGISVLCLFIPFISDFKEVFSFTAKNSPIGAGTARFAYMALGGVGTLYFSFITFYFIFNVISPPAALTVEDTGIYDYTVGGSGAGFIPRDAIVSLRILGTQKKPCLGIRVAAEYVVALGNNIAAKKAVHRNLEAGLPGVIISESDIYMSVKKLLKLLVDEYGTADKTANRSIAQQSSFADETKQEAFETLMGVSLPENPLLSSSGGKIFSDADASSAVFDTAEQKLPDTRGQTPDVLTIDNRPEAGQITLYNTKSPTPILVDPDPKRIKNVDELIEQLLNNK